MLINLQSDIKWSPSTQNITGRESTEQKQGGVADHCAVHLPSAILALSSQGQCRFPDS